VKICIEVYFESGKLGLHHSELLSIQADCYTMFQASIPVFYQQLIAKYILPFFTSKVLLEQNINTLYAWTRCSHSDYERVLSSGI
jgi:hypothetical protein